MSKQKAEGIAYYEDVNDNYLKRRRLQGNASSALLWSLGVGAVISGNFFGWNFGLTAGGFWRLTIATFLMAVMYVCMVCMVCMVYSIADSSAML